LSHARQLFLLRFAVLFVGLVLLQLPFLHADADGGLGFSRGPYTDEGLYSAQVRNAMVTGHLDLAESDGVLKTPLFAMGAWLALAGFGDSMGTLRAAVVLCCGLFLALMASGSSAFSRMLRLAIPLGFLSYFPFHYGHLALAEMPSCIAIVAALFLVHLRLQGAGAWTLAASGLLAFVAYALKVQFVYAAVIPAVAFAAVIVLRWLSGMAVPRRAWTDVLASAAIAAAFAALYAVAWVLPNRDLFAAISGQVSGHSSSLADIPRTAIGNVHEILREPGVWPLLLLVGLGVVWAAREWRASASDPQARLAWIGLMAPSFAWAIVEMHKLSLNYLPSRYIVSLLVAVSLFGAAAICTRQRPLFKRPANLRHAAGLAVLVMAVALNAVFYVKSLRDRRYVIDGVQAALAAEGRWRGKLAMGPWAPTLFWGTGAVTKPIWHGAYNDRNILARFNPAAIVTEPDQQDSSQALSADGLRLPTHPDLSLRVQSWNLQIYQWPPR